MKRSRLEYDDRLANLGMCESNLQHALIMARLASPKTADRIRGALRTVQGAIRNARAHNEDTYGSRGQR